MLNIDISKNIISKSKSIINNTYKLVEIQKKDTITEKKSYSNPHKYQKNALISSQTFEM